MKNIPDILLAAWRGYGDKRNPVNIVEISAFVSTNQVFRLDLNDGNSVVAKISSYGSYIDFREDHDRIHRWNQLLINTRYKNFLADALLKENEIYTYYNGFFWVIFYNAVAIKNSLPSILTEEEIVSLAVELATFHRECEKLARELPGSSKSLKSDILQLLELLNNERWQAQNRFSSEELIFLNNECYTFLLNLEYRTGHDTMPRVPVLIDWNIGNFSIDMAGDSFKFFSRWDYDWFRIESRMFDFYFCSRVVREAGDEKDFSYLAQPLLEDRFRLFLKSYHKINPLSLLDVLFLKEAYRFFILNYVIKDGEHFFKPSICSRLKKEAITIYLPGLDKLEFNSLCDSLVGK